MIDMLCDFDNNPAFEDGLCEDCHSEYESDATCERCGHFPAHVVQGNINAMYVCPQCSDAWM